MLDAALAVCDTCGMSNKITSQRPLRSLRAISAALDALLIGARVAVRFKPVGDEVWRFYAPDDAVVPGLFVIEDADEVSISSAMLGVIVAGRELEMCVAERNNESMYRLDNDVVRDARLWITPEHIATLRVLPSPVHVRIDGMMNNLVLEPDGSAYIGDNEITPAGLRRMYDAIGGHLGLKSKLEA